MLGISPRTVEFHRANLMRKPGARNTADLVRDRHIMVEFHSEKSLAIRDEADFPTDDGELARKLAIAIRAAALGIWEWDLRHNTFLFSDQAKEIFGFDRDCRSRGTRSSPCCTPTTTA